MILFDTSALGKLLREEKESQALEEFVNSCRKSGEEMIVSVIATIELRRLAIRNGFDSAAVQQLLRVFTVVDVTPSIVALSGWIADKHLRTIDAIQIATAVAAHCSNIVTYDESQAQAAAEEGIIAIAPR